MTEQPKNPGRFEGWLRKQRKRDDETGEVARWVAERGNYWRASRTMDTSQVASKAPAPDWKVLRTWRKDLRTIFNQSERAVQVFERVYAEYCQERDRYRESLKSTE